MLKKFFNTGTISNQFIFLFQIHHHMTPHELQYVFHVEQQDIVPQYHLVHLNHHLSRRHIPGTSANSFTNNEGKIPHEKHYKYKTETSPPSLLNDEMFKAGGLKDVIGDLNDTVSVNFDVGSSESDSEVLSDVHKIDLEAFGKQLSLVLRKQEGLVKKEGLKMWRAVTNETQPHGVDYEEMRTVS